MGRDVIQPETDGKLYVTSFLFKLKSKPAAFIVLYKVWRLMELI